MLNLGRLENFVDFGEVFIVGLVAAANNNDEITMREGINGHTGGARVGGEIVVVVFDAV